MSFTVEMRGINAVVRDLKKLGHDVGEETDKAMGYSARVIERDAKKNVDVDTGDLRASIHLVDKFLEKEVKTDKTHAPFVEFGTKSKVDIPSGLESYAMQFKSSGGNFADLLESIKGWCSRKGIDKEFAYPIALKIAQNGVSARPFLFPAYRKEIPNLEKKLERIVSKAR